MTVDQRDPEPLYLQLARIIRDKIRTGEISDVLPSNRTLRETYDVGEQVVTHALSVLKEEGLIFSVPRRGYYVRQKSNRED